MSPKHIIVSAEFTKSLTDALVPDSPSPVIWAHGDSDTPFPRIDLEIDRQSGEPYSKDERPCSASTILRSTSTHPAPPGCPRPRSVSHARVMQWSHWFAGMMEVQPTDRMYNCLPMYHSVGGVQAPGAALVAGGSVVLREKFSASQFWSDIVRWDCTLFQYIGELCRYLLHAEPCRRRNRCIAFVWPAATGWRRRFGTPSRNDSAFRRSSNSMRPPRAAFPCSTCRENAARSATFRRIWRIVFRRRWSSSIAKPASRPATQQGFCIPCAPNQPGEALGKVMNDPANVGSRFEGYTTEEATEKKNPAQRLRARRCLGPHRRPDAEG